MLPVVPLPGASPVFAYNHNHAAVPGPTMPDVDHTRRHHPMLPRAGPRIRPTTRNRLRIDDRMATRPTPRQRYLHTNRPDVFRARRMRRMRQNVRRLANFVACRTDPVNVMARNRGRMRMRNQSPSRQRMPDRTPTRSDHRFRGARHDVPFVSGWRVRMRHGMRHERPPFAFPPCHRDCVRCR
jgi:hypothetical protein